MAIRLRGIVFQMSVGIAIVAVLMIATGVGLSGDIAADDDDEFNQSEIEQQFIGHLNEERKSRGLQPVEQRDELTEMGDGHAEDMAANGYFSHTNLNGKNIEDRFQERGLLPECRLENSDGRYYPGAENLATVEDLNLRLEHRGGTVTLRTESDIARYLFEGWMDSPGHREAMLVHSASEAGLGIAVSEDGEFYAALELC